MSGAPPRIRRKPRRVTRKGDDPAPLIQYSSQGWHSLGPNSLIQFPNVAMSVRDPEAHALTTGRPGNRIATYHPDEACAGTPGLWRKWMF